MYNWPTIMHSNKTFRKLYRLVKLWQHTAPEKGMNNIHGWPFRCRAVLLFPVLWDNRYHCCEINRRDYGTLPTGKCIKQQHSTHSAKLEKKPWLLTCTFFALSLHAQMLQRQCRKVIDLLLKSMQTVVIVQVTEQSSNSCLTAVMSNTISSTTVPFLRA